MRSIRVPCGNELDLQFARHHLPLGLGVETDAAYDCLAQELGLDQLADPLVRRRSVVGDHGEVALLLAHDLVDDVLGVCPTAMNPPIIRLAPFGIMATD